MSGDHKLNKPSVADPVKQNIRQLTIIRSLLLVFFWCGLLANFWAGNLIHLNKEILIVLIVFNVIHVLTFLRLRRPLPITHIEFFIQLLLDVIFLNLVFYFCGGASNPFISYLLVPVCISAATLPWRFTWIITALCVGAYSILLFFYVSMPIFAVDHTHIHSQLNWHILGMWFNFFLSAILITYFVVKMAGSLRQREEALTKMREDELRNEQVIAVATLAAGAAHEINTPLATMVVLLNELLVEYKNNAHLVADLTLLSQQVSHCADSLKQMVQDSSSAVNGVCKQQNITFYCQSILDRWQLIHPEVTVFLALSYAAESQLIAYDTRLDHAIINLLNNAAEASPEKVSINIKTDAKNLYWQIIDEGAGIDADLSQMLGRQAVTTKKSGLGLGLLLSHTTINHYGGSVSQSKNFPHGTITLITLPLGNMGRLS